MKLIIVESPAKCKTIQKYLGNEYIVKASGGHIRDLAKKGGIDINNNFKPTYVNMAKKAKYINELKKCQKQVSEVIIATDADREGHAIGWHIAKVLKLNISTTKRIIFHEITKNALNTALKNPTTIDMNQVNSQQARRILDRLVGFELSPLLWKYIQNSLSAGRVQSVATKMIIEKDKEIENFKREGYYEVKGVFIISSHNDTIQATRESKNKIINKNQAIAFLKLCNKSKFILSDITQINTKKTPPVPFTTSTIQQSAGSLMNLSPKFTMGICQKLYEKGKITYHRTDSIALSEYVLDNIKEYILNKYGEDYYTLRIYKNKSKDAQEAHEAIRPTDINVIKLDKQFSDVEKKLYSLIWKRTVASQMACQKLKTFEIKINILLSKNSFFKSALKKVTFDGYTIIYNCENENKEKLIKLVCKLSMGTELKYEKIVATEKMTNPPQHYSEHSLVKQLKKLGIGRPSTYATIIDTIQNRGYVVKTTKSGKKVDYNIITLNGDIINEKKDKITLDVQKNKLFPTEIGVRVNQFLNSNFINIMDYKFTSKIESNLDKISNGDKKWHSVVNKIYNIFHPTVDKLNKECKIQVNTTNDMKLLGINENKQNVYAYNGRYGPVIQIGDDKKTCTFIGLEKCSKIKDLTMDNLDKFINKRLIGKYNDNDIYQKKGKYGVYLTYNGANYSLPKNESKNKITIEEAIKIISQKKSSVIKDFGNCGIKVMNGKYGPYIRAKNKNIKIPKKIDLEILTLDVCKELIKLSNK